MNKIHSFLKWFIWPLEWVHEMATFEFLLTRCRLANGSHVIVIRSLATAATIYSLTLGLKNAIDPERSWSFNFRELRIQLLETSQWFGLLFAGVYTALYSRFSSQWTYLSNVYHQIKAAQCHENCVKEHLADWKAGFIEDAEDLHLARKPAFASIVKAWAAEEGVKATFITNTPWREKRFNKLIQDAEKVWQQSEKVHGGK